MQFDESPYGVDVGGYRRIVARVGDLVYLEDDVKCYEAFVGDPHNKVVGMDLALKLAEASGTLGSSKPSGWKRGKKASP